MRIAGLFGAIESWLYRRAIAGALALNSRGEARRDGLTIVTSSMRLSIQWRARDIHPWDRGLARHDHDLAFQEQLLSDTESAVMRLFDALPQLETMDVVVLHPKSDSVLIAGAVQRSALTSARALRSLRMRVQELGLQCSSQDSVVRGR